MSIKNITRVVAILALSLFTLSPLNAATNYLTLPDLKLGDVSIYVKEIQKVLNSNGFTVNTEGQPGSTNNETTKFGALTVKALAAFQSKYNLTPAKGYFGVKTKSKFNEVGKITVAKGGTPSKGVPVAYGSDRCSSITVNNLGRPGTADYQNITWTFAPTGGQYPLCGKYANGEDWVVGPVTVTNITPNSSMPNNGGPCQNNMRGTKDANGNIIQDCPWVIPTGSNGSMINPVFGQKQGFDARFSSPYLQNIPQSMLYDATKNVSLNFPINLASNDVLVSSIGGRGYPPDFVYG